MPDKNTGSRGKESASLAQRSQEVAEGIKLPAGTRQPLPQSPALSAGPDEEEGGQGGGRRAEGVKVMTGIKVVGGNDPKGPKPTLTFQLGEFLPFPHHSSSSLTLLSMDSEKMPGK